MDSQLPFSSRKVCEVRPLSPVEDNTMEQSEANKAEFKSFSQHDIEQLSSRLGISRSEIEQLSARFLTVQQFQRCEIEEFSSRFLAVELPAEDPVNNYFEDALFEETSPRLPIPQRQISVSWPPSPESNINKRMVSSLDIPYLHTYFLDQQDPVASGLKDKSPFLLRIHAGHFHIFLGLCSQTVLWKALEKDSSFFPFTLKLPTHMTFGLWLFALASFLVISGAYILKCFFHFDSVRKEYCDHVRVNYFFIPWIAGMLLRLGLPSNIAPDRVHPIVWCTLMAPITILELKIYGQWFIKGRRSLALIANPSTHLSVIGNFLVARLATRMEWRETAMFFFTVGFVHYLVVFISLYQRLSPDIIVSRKMWPVLFLFIAGPSSACVAWQAISGSFDTVCRMLLFLSLFLYSALILQVKFFLDAIREFSVAWWACAYPVTTASIATIRYAHEVRHPIANTLAFVLCSASTGIVLLLVVVTTIDMVVARERLFPNDVVLSIYVEKGRKSSNKRKRRRTVHRFLENERHLSDQNI